MGLGKTLQTLAFLLAEKAAGKEGDELRTLVVCPASLVYNWQKEIETYAPELSFRVIAGLAEARKEMIRDGEDADVWITSYDLLKRDISLYEGLVFANEIIDEAQYVKNQNTQAAQSVRVIDSRFRLALTGTPIENHLGELWSIMDYLMPGFLYSNARFQKEYELPIVAEKDEALLARLRRMVHPFILRRLKRQVLKDLPAKLEETITVRLCDEQKRLYDAATEQVRQALYKTDDSQFGSEKLQFLSMLTKLRQICCDPSLVGGGGRTQAAAVLSVYDDARYHRSGTGEEGDRLSQDRRQCQQGKAHGDGGLLCQRRCPGVLHFPEGGRNGAESDSGRHRHPL